MHAGLPIYRGTPASLVNAVKLEGPQAFRPTKRCPKNDVFLFFWGLMRLKRGGMDLVWVKSVFWFVKYVDFYVIFL